LKLVQLREPGLDPASRAVFAKTAVALCHRYGARVLVNGDAELAASVGADGLHLPAAQLAHLQQRPDFHAGRGLLPFRAGTGTGRAAGLRLCGIRSGAANGDPSREPLASAGRDSPLKSPYRHCRRFGLGGLSRVDLDRAQQAGAHGIAAIRAAWEN
jgi:8-oxo-dGTP diphosphatase